MPSTVLTSPDLSRRVRITRRRNGRYFVAQIDGDGWETSPRKVSTYEAAQAMAMALVYHREGGQQS